MKNSLFAQCKTLIGNKSGSIEDKSRKVCMQRGVFGHGGSTGVTMHSRMVCLSSEDNLVSLIGCLLQCPAAASR